MDRISRIVASETVLNMYEGSSIVLHFFPIESFQRDIHLNIETIAQDWHKVPMLYAGASDYRVNLDGLLLEFTLNNGTCGAYTQLFANGILEIVNSYFLEPNPDGSRSIPAIEFEKKVIETTCESLRFLQSHELQPPIYLCLSLLNIEGYVMGISQASRFSSPRAYSKPIDRSELIFPAVRLEEYSQDIGHALKSIFDSVWNSAGWPKSLNYDMDGNWLSG